MAVTSLRQAQSRNVVISELMETMGWSKARAKYALRELEEHQLVVFPSEGGMNLQVIGKAVI